ncbi:hypothetical protein CS542_08845 [Pedobacter sp. IW39]|nr:hypothetical protein CS542_08845 [Pedobacter sp. IW39]
MVFHYIVNSACSAAYSYKTPFNVFPSTTRLSTAYSCAKTTLLYQTPPSYFIRNLFRQIKRK